METLLKIIEEKMLLIEQLQIQLKEQTERAEENSKGMIYWYEKCTSLEADLASNAIESNYNSSLTSKTDKNV